jgi:AraC-like DNA-binding protein
VLRPDQLQRLCRARAELRDLRDGPQRIPDVARRAGFSPFHFSRLYRAVFGETPHDCQSTAQCALARRLLLAPGATVTRVCMRVGFASVGSFSVVFKRRTGLSPAAFQRRYRRADGALPAELIPGCFALMAPASSANSEKCAASGTGKSLSQP